MLIKRISMIEKGNYKFFICYNETLHFKCSISVNG